MSFNDAYTPVCGRHPDRVTYVSCTRCGSPICPDCMITAPVGFHCPDCVKAERARIGRVRDDEPRLTNAIIMICVAVQVAANLNIGTTSGWLDEFSLFPARVAVYGEYYRMLTAVFVHAGWLHLGMNMIMFWSMGRVLERILGHWRFLALFLIAGLGGSVASYWFNDPLTVGVGASGAIFGMFAAMFMLGRELRASTQEIVTVIGLNLVIGFIVPGVDWHAHLGGLLTGAAVGWAILPSRHRAIRTLMPGVMVLVLAALTQWRTDELLKAIMAGFHS